MCPVRWKYLFVEFEILFPDERTQFQGFGLVSFTRMNTKWCHQTDLKLGGVPFCPQLMWGKHSTYICRLRKLSILGLILP